MSFPIFEALMLLSFGMAWPMSIWKSWYSRTNKGKSLFFLLIIFFGYGCGLVHKLFWQAKVDGAVWLYLVDQVMVGIDLILFYRNQLIDAAGGTAHDV